MEAKFTRGPWEFSAPTMAGSERVVVEAYGFGSIAAISLNGAPRHQSRLQATSPYHEVEVERCTLPIFPDPKSRVIIPDPDAPGAKLRTWTMTPARDVDGKGLCIKCVGAGEVPAGQVRIA